jgi:hypothetical protein
MKPAVFGAILVAVSFRPSSAFSIGPSSLSSIHSWEFETALFGVKRGKLRSNIDADPSEILSRPTRKEKQARGDNRASKVNKGWSSVETPAISSDLAKWAVESGAVSSTEIAPEAASKSTSASGSNTSKSKKNVDRRTKQAERQAKDEELKKRLQKIMFQLEDLFEVEKNRDISSILGLIQELVETPQASDSVSMRTLLGVPKRRDYRMVWAGSDEAICHVGTGLHKVPLARLQEVFMTIGKGYVEIQEVIRVIGPFPNVKNSLTGDVTAKSGGSSIKIIYDRMIDGTGKELAAGKSENERTVLLNVLHASEHGIVCQVPRNDNNETVPLSSNSSSLLVFLPEPDLDSALEVLRVA